MFGMFGVVLAALAPFVVLLLAVVLPPVVALAVPASLSMSNVLSMPHPEAS